MTDVADDPGTDEPEPESRESAMQRLAEKGIEEGGPVMRFFSWRLGIALNSAHIKDVLAAYDVVLAKCSHHTDEVRARAETLRPLLSVWTSEHRDGNAIEPSIDRLDELLTRMLNMTPQQIDALAKQLEPVEATDAAPQSAPADGSTREGIVTIHLDEDGKVDLRRAIPYLKFATSLLLESGTTDPRGGATP